jgi:NAD(P)-dependent dehydrogenase (short-subunit alcohol dehydrogenase family)
MDLNLAGKAALVTGSGRGIGFAVARVLAAEGMSVALLGRDTEALGGAVDELGSRAVAVRADTTVNADVVAAVEEVVAEFGRLDVVVNCAAPRATPSQVPGIDGLDDEDFLHQVDTKALGYLRVIRAAMPHLKAAGGGNIVNVSGMNARVTGSITGSVRNIAVAAITKNLADELGASGISVTCVHPGLTVTERVAGDESFLEQAAGNALSRPVTAAEVADVIAFLASPRGAVANGSVVAVDGGRLGSIWT